MTTFRRTAFLGTILLLPLVALSNDSLWIDEANSALKAMQPSLGSWWHVLTSEKGSDLQMPFYMFYLWAWEKLAGHSELALRLANVPWLFLGHYSLYRLCHRRGIDPLPLLAMASVNAFVWFYLNEARPYLMQYAGACLVIACLDDMLNATRTYAGFKLAGAGILVLAASSLLGMAWAASAMIALVFVFFRAGKPPRNGEMSFLACLLLGLVALGVFYFWTLTLGARGTSVGQMDWRNLSYATFELAGFAGLGPGRLQIREEGLACFYNYLPAICALAVVLCMAFFHSLPALCQSKYRPRLIAALLYALPAAIALVGFSLIANFHLLGRHFAPLTPLVVVLVTIGVVRMWHSKWKAVSLAVWILWLASSLSLRFAPRHKKDDYRDAAAEAREGLTQNKVVWWVADRAGANYYHLPLEQPDARLSLVVNASQVGLQALSPPDLVILSKPELYDMNHAVITYLEDKKYRIWQTFPAFTVWQR